MFRKNKSKKFITREPFVNADVDGKIYNKNIEDLKIVAMFFGKEKGTK